MNYCALLDASTNPDIARLFYTKLFRGILESAQGLQHEVKNGIQRPKCRLKNRRVFEEAL